MADKNEQNTPPGKVLGTGPKQFLIAPRRINGADSGMSAGWIGLGMHPGLLDHFEQALRSSPDVEIVNRIVPRGLVGTLADGMAGVPQVLIAKMADDKAEILKQQSMGQLIVERDQPLRLDVTETAEPGFVAGAVAAQGPSVSVAIMVLGRDNTPVTGAEVHLFGGLMPASAVTDERGVATLSMSDDDLESITGLYVKPRADYWTLYQAQPALDTHQTNLVYVRSLADSFPGFPRQQVMGWGQKMMRLDHLPATFRGQGVRIAIADSGAGTSHPALHGIKLGLDLSTRRGDQSAWNRDTIGHGSHCAGVIAGADTGSGIRGFAPEAEIHVCKQFPGGQISQLLEVLEYCIEKQIDIVNLSLSCAEPSEVLEQQILRATRLGTACIAAAGNSGGPVQYPASSRNVLAVAAIGRMGEFPADSYHAQTVRSTDGNGLFSPNFTCFGPEISVCGPGVAILSCVPPSNFAAWDGTSMAAAHITGLGALVLAHHPDFQGPFKVRNAARVARLFQILRASARPVNVGDIRRTGFGLPDVLIALGLAPQVQPQASSVFANGGRYPNPSLFVNAMAFGMGPGGMNPAGLYNRYQDFAQFGAPAPAGIW